MGPYVLTKKNCTCRYVCLQNPQMDIQAMARCHRIGQKRPVVIYKLCTKGTIDEAIMTRAEAKRFLEKMVISKKMQALNLNNKQTLIELQRLLDSKECQVATSKNEGNHIMTFVSM